MMKMLALAELVCQMKKEYDAEVKHKEGKTKYDAKRKRISTVRCNPQETSDETEDDNEENIFEVLGNMSLFCYTCDVEIK